MLAELGVDGLEGRRVDRHRHVQGDDSSGLGRELPAVLVHVVEFTELDDGAGREEVDPLLVVVEQFALDGVVIELDRVDHATAPLDLFFEQQDAEGPLAHAVGQELDVGLVFLEVHRRFPGGPEVLWSVPLLELGGFDESSELRVLEDLHPRGEVLRVLARDEDEAVEHVPHLGAPIVELALPLVVAVVGENERRSRLATIDMARPPHLVVQREVPAVVESVEVDAPELNLAVGVDDPEIEPVAVLLVHRGRPDRQAVEPVVVHLARRHGVLHHIPVVEGHGVAIAIGSSLPLRHHDRLVGVGKQADAELDDRRLAVLGGFRVNTTLPGREFRNTADDAGLLVDDAFVGLARPRDGGQAEPSEIHPLVVVINAGKHAHVVGHWKSPELGRKGPVWLSKVDGAQ